MYFSLSLVRGQEILWGFEDCRGLIVTHGRALLQAPTGGVIL
jgi:hypothetical protein